MLFCHNWLTTKRGKRWSWWWWWWKPTLSIFRRIALENWRLKYIAIKRPVGEDLTVGAKLNLTILLASGPYIVSFDDDLYADRYAEHNVLYVPVGIGHGDCHATAKLGRRDIVRFDPPDTVTATKFWHSSKLEAVQDEHFNLILDRDTALAVSYVHLRVLSSFLIQTRRLWKMRLESPETPGRCWWALPAHRTPPAVLEIQTSGSGVLLSRWDTNGFDLFMKGYSKSFWWFTGIFTSLFHFWSWLNHEMYTASRCNLLKYVLCNFWSGNLFFVYSNVLPF